jgi:hypothetical protein
MSNDLSKVKIEKLKQSTLNSVKEFCEKYPSDFTGKDLGDRRDALMKWAYDTMY